MSIRCYDINATQDNLEEIINTIRADPQYHSHEITENDDGSVTITACFNPPAAVIELEPFVPGLSDEPTRATDRACEG